MIIKLLTGKPPARRTEAGEISLRAICPCAQKYRRMTPLQARMSAQPASTKSLSFLHLPVRLAFPPPATNNRKRAGPRGGRREAALGQRARR